MSYYQFWLWKICSVIEKELTSDMWILLPCDDMCLVQKPLIPFVFNFSELNETTVLMNLKKRYDQELVYVCSVFRYADWILNIIKCYRHCKLHPHIHFFLSLSYFHIDLHRQHPCFCESLQVAQHLWHRHGASVRGPQPQWQPSVSSESVAVCACNTLSVSFVCPLLFGKEAS